MAEKPNKKTIKSKDKSRKGHDIVIKFFDSFIRIMDSIKKSIDAMKEVDQDIDAMVNNGVGYIEDKKLTHGISQGAVNSGVYGGTDLVYNPNTGEYIVLTKMGEIIRYDWTGKKVGSVMPSKKFSRILYVPQSSNYICYTPGKSAIFVLKEEFHLAIDTVSISPIDKMIISTKKTEENTVEFFIAYKDSLNKYSYNPAGNSIALQECLKIADIEAEGAVIEQICFDEALDEKSEKKQWIYMTFKQHVTIIDATGRAHGTKKNLHRLPITAIVVIGPSEYVVTGDSVGLLKMWGSRWAFLTEIRPHSAMCSHLIEHPNGRAIVSFSTDQTIFAWSLDSKRKLESLKAPEIVERIAINQAGKSFAAIGPRKLVLWRMDVLFSPLTTISSNVRWMQMVWHPDYPPRTIVVQQDNSIRFLNPITGKIITTALINPQKPPLTDCAYHPQYNILYVIKTPQDDHNSIEMQLFDCKLNPCKIKEIWEESKWNNLGITAIALFDLIPSIQVPEKIMNFTSKKTVEVQGPTTFLICGMQDGTVGRINIHTGEMDFKVLCHKGHVCKIRVNPDVCQFASLGNEPSIRIWKIFVNSEEVFVPIFEVVWKYPVHHISIVREAICFALSHHDSPTHKIVVYNTVDTERHDHRAHFAHTKEVLSVSGSRELKIFCSSSLDETIRIWDDKCDLIRLLALNWVPSYAAFGTPQGDIFCAIGNVVNFIAADRYLPIIYRNRAMVNKFSPGPKEASVPLSTQRTTQDPRMYIILEEEEKLEKERKEKEKEKEKKRFVPPGMEKKEEEDDKDIKIPKIENFREPKDSQRAKDYEKFCMLNDDLKQIIEGNHNFSIYIPDFHKMTKKQLDDYGKTIFTGEDGDKRKMFASESRVAGVVEMDRAMKELDNFVED